MEPELHRGNLFLVGMMGSGKSTLGRQLARALRKRFVDSDVEIESQTGVEISTIFEVEGEEGFRDREESILAQLCESSDIVLATGGGAVIRERNRAALRQNGTVVYLHVRVDTLWDRTKNSRHRPLLRTEDPKSKLKELYQVRDPLYRAAAHIVLDADRCRVQQVLAALSDLERADDA